LFVRLCFIFLHILSLDHAFLTSVVFAQFLFAKLVHQSTFTIWNGNRCQYCTDWNITTSVQVTNQYVNNQLRMA